MLRLARTRASLGSSPSHRNIVRSFHFGSRREREFKDWGTEFSVYIHDDSNKEPYLKLPKLSPIHNVPLTQEFPGTPPASQLVSKFAHHVPTEITTLSNGLRIATREKFGQATAFSLFVDSGTIYESDQNHGASHIIERMAFKSTKKMASKDLVQELEVMGGNISSSSSREIMSYFAEVIHEEFPRTLELIAQATLEPKFDEEELEEVKEQISFELSQMRIDSLFTEILHREAFSGQPLGRPFYAPLEQLNNLTPDTVRQFHNQHYSPDRMVLAVVGRPHREAVAIAENILGGFPKSTQSIPQPKSLYTGGRLLLEEQEGDVDPHSRDLPVSHIALAFETPGLQHQDMYALYALNILLGGGGSFSSGGPGKGMYSRLYQQVLNGYHFVESCYAFYSAYHDNGMFGIFGTVEHGKVPEMLDVLASSYLDLLQNITEEEFQRAKNQLKSTVLMGLETRGVLADDIARQVIYYGKHMPIEETCRRIDSLTVEDIRRVAFDFLQTRPTIVAHGQNVPNLPEPEFIQDFFKKHSSSL